MDVRKSSSTNVNDVVVSKEDKVVDDDMIDMVEYDGCEKGKEGVNNNDDIMINASIVKKNDTYANVMKQVDQDGLNSGIEQGPWLVNNKPIILQRWDPDVGIVVVDPTKQPDCAKRGTYEAVNDD
ncbi:hypothetical protein Tco_0909805 [Tanacetum coccineum]|uniref:Uncharacterized protein n=1 Tax=Tanacetum coccineum TaxID=301880 RepID=A0ABQ5CSB5_9ASTR